MSLLMDLMHLIDVVNYLIQDKITTLSVWGWTKQLRYYLLDTRLCVARMVCRTLCRVTFDDDGNRDGMQYGDTAVFLLLLVVLSCLTTQPWHQPHP